MEQNCWEFMNCGRDKTNDCPAYPKYGQSCWWVAGTRCKGVIQGTYAKTIEDCSECPWFSKLVVEESGSRQAKGISQAENCWQFWNCGRDKLGDCPAFPNEGKHCWLVAGTKCADGIQGTFARIFSGNLKSCDDCPWYLNVTDRLLASAKTGTKEQSD